MRSASSQVYSELCWKHSVRRQLICKSTRSLLFFPSSTSSWSLWFLLSICLSIFWNQICAAKHFEHHLLSIMLPPAHLPSPISIQTWFLSYAPGQIGHSFNPNFQDYSNFFAPQIAPKNRRRHVYAHGSVPASWRSFLVHASTTSLTGFVSAWLGLCFCLTCSMCLCSTSTIMPLLNTFVIFVVVEAIWSVLATQFFGTLMPDKFGTFSASVLTMFQVVHGHVSMPPCLYGKMFSFCAYNTLFCIRECHSNQSIFSSGNHSLASCRGNSEKCHHQMCTGDGWMTDVVRPLIEIGQDQVLASCLSALWCVIMRVCIRVRNYQGARARSRPLPSLFHSPSDSLTRSFSFVLNVLWVCVERMLRERYLKFTSALSCHGTAGLRVFFDLDAIVFHLLHSTGLRGSPQRCRRCSAGRISEVQSRVRAWWVNREAVLKQIHFQKHQTVARARCVKLENEAQVAVNLMLATVFDFVMYLPMQPGTVQSMTTISKWKPTTEYRYARVVFLCVMNLQHMYCAP